MTLKRVKSLYSEREVRQYLAYIHFPAFDQLSKGEPSGEALSFPEPTLATLTLLQQHHLLNIPFENTSMHYERSHGVSINPKVVLQRFCSRRMGGYCMQHNVCLLNILRFLGYKCYAVAGRVLERTPDGKEGDYEGFGHMVILVQLPNHLANPQQAHEHLYVVDVGYGAQGPLRPLLLIDEHVEEGRFNERHRLIRRLPKASAFEEDGGHASSVGQVEQEMRNANKIWHLQHAKGHGPWQTQYTFLMTETFPNDFEKLNFATSQDPRSIFVSTLMLCRFTLDLAASDQNGAKESSTAAHHDLHPYPSAAFGLHALLGARFSHRPPGGGPTEHEEVQTEEERVQRIREVFGLLSGLETEHALDAIQEGKAALPQRRGCEPES